MPPPTPPAARHTLINPCYLADKPDEMAAIEAEKERMAEFKTEAE